MNETKMKKMYNTHDWKRTNVVKHQVFRCIRTKSAVNIEKYWYFSYSLSYAYKLFSMIKLDTYQKVIICG